MRGEPWACLGGVEIVNGARTLAYLESAGISGLSAHRDGCDCSNLYADPLCYMELDGTGDTASTPDDASLDITGDITLVWFGALNTYGTAQFLMGKWLESGDQRSYTLFRQSTSMQFSLSSDGTGASQVNLNRTSSHAPGERVGLLGDWRQSDGRARLFLADDPTDPLGTTWTQMGADGTLAIASIHSGSGRLGVTHDGSTSLQGLGKHFYAAVYDGLLLDASGTIVANPDFSNQSPGTTSFVDGTGKTYTLNGDAHIVCPVPRPSEEFNPAPWYDVARPESAEFLGLYVTPELPTVLRREVTNRISGGGIVGPLRPSPRLVAFAGSMYASSVRGMAYGERWLQDVLSGQMCADGCAADLLELVTSCPGNIYAMFLDGTGDFASTPDDSSLDIVSDIDLRAAAALTDWTPSSGFQALVSKQAPPNASYQLDVASTLGRLRMVWTTNGSTFITVTSSTSPAVANGSPLLVRATLDVDNGASQQVVTFYTKPLVSGEGVLAQLEDDAGWTQLGTNPPVAGTTSIFSGSAQMTIGARSAGDSNFVNGDIFAVVVKSGINGDTVANPDFSIQDEGTTSFTDNTGKVWTLNGNAHIADSGLDDETSFRQLVNVGIVDGPVFGDPIGRSCQIQEVSFQLEAGNSYLYSRPATVLETALTTTDSESITISASEWEHKVIRLTIEQTATGAGGLITVTATPIAEGDDCDDAGALNPCAFFTIATEFGSQVIIDSRDHSATVYHRHTEEVESALGMLTFEDLFPWLELDPCSQICLSIASGPAANIKVETFTKEI